MKSDKETGDQFQALFVLSNSGLEIRLVSKKKKRNNFGGFLITFFKASYLQNNFLLGSAVQGKRNLKLDSTTHFLNNITKKNQIS